MTGSGLAAIVIPIAGTIFLAVWLALVFYAGRPRRVGGNPAPAHERPGLDALADRRQPGACPPDPTGPLGTGPLQDAHTTRLACTAGLRPSGHPAGNRQKVPAGHRDR